MKKKGVSPLLAAVLLIAIAIALGAIVSNFLIKEAKKFNPEELAQQSVYCESVNLGYKVNDAEDLCIGHPSGFDILQGVNITNKGSFAIQGFKITAPGFNSRDYPVTNAINPGGGEIIEIQINNDLDDKKIKIVPIVKDLEKNQNIVCADRALIMDYGQLFANPEDQYC